MGTYKVEVFIASRFQEFHQLRERLCREIAVTEHLAPVDLNDGYARAESPLAACLSRARRTELFVLILGDTYGEAVRGRSKSYTHLEYEEAVRPGSKTRVLVFHVSQASLSAQDSRQIPAAWLRKLHARHTVARLDPSDHPEQQAREIMKQIYAAAYDLLSGKVSARDAQLLYESAAGRHHDGDDSSLDDLSEAVENAFDDGELDSLEEIEANARGGDASDASSEPDERDASFGVHHPAEVAALEQRKEAEHAIALGEYGIAIQHLGRCLALRPLDGAAALSLARLYVLIGRRDRLGKAAELAVRAANLAAEAQQPYRAANAYLLAARALTELGDTPGAHDCVDRALDIEAPFAKVHLERARIFCREGKADQAIGCVREAFHIHTPSLKESLKDPYLRDIHDQLRQLVRTEANQWRTDVERLLSIEQTLHALAAAPADFPSPTGGFQRLRSLGQLSIARQRDLVAQLLESAATAERSSRSDEAQSDAAEHCRSIARLERDLADAQRGGPLFFTFGANHPQVVHDIEEALATARAQLRALQLRADEAKSRAKAALELFEQTSLCTPARYQPFPNLRRARPGKLVRVSSKAAEQFEKRYRRRIERDDESFGFGFVNGASGFALYQVTAVRPAAICLSRRAAYALGQPL